MRFRQRALRIRRRHGSPICTVAEYLRQTQPVEYAMLCTLAGTRDYAAGATDCKWDAGVNEPLAVLERIMKQPPRSRGW